jgi:hypothetical protein
MGLILFNRTSHRKTRMVLVIKDKLKRRDSVKENMMVMC